jgi:hypothetical protein
VCCSHTKNVIAVDGNTRAIVYTLGIHAGGDMGYVLAFSALGGF